MSSGATETLYLIDAHSLIFQVFHAIPTMTGPQGLPTNALFGFTRDLIYLRQRKPTYLLCVFDMEGPVFRNALDAQYKANRSPMPDDLKLQIPLIRDQLLPAMRIPVLGVAGFEADDVIATLALRGAGRGADVYICSSDKDCRQLLGERVRIFSLRKREVFDAAALLKDEDWGIRPDQVIDYQTLVGDSVDNVKGVQGVGPKTASKLLQQYGTLDNLLTHLDDFKGKKRENFDAALPYLQRSRQLVTLKTDVPISEDWEAWRLQPWDAENLYDLFRGWGFRQFADQARASMDKAARSAEKAAQDADGSSEDEAASQPAARKRSAQARDLQGDLFSGLEGVETRSAVDGWEGTYHLIDTPEKFAPFLAQLVQQPRFAVDVAATHQEPRRARLAGLAFCWQAGEGWYVPVRGASGHAMLNEQETLAALRPILEAPAVGKVNQNIKYDLEVLRQHGVRLAGVVGDSMVADYLLHAGERSHNMEVLAEKHLKHRPIPISDLLGKGKSHKSMDEAPPAEAAVYAGEDADMAWRLCAHLEPLLQHENLKRPPARLTEPGRDDFFLYDDLEIPLIGVLADMEFTGIRVDVPLLQRLSGEMARSLDQLEQEIYHLAGRAFNIASVKQLREVMYSELGYKPGRKTAITGAASTDQETLEKLAREGHGLPIKLLEHRKIAKLKGTYVDALPALVNETTGRIHASFNQTVAATGRLSGSDPNLQNIPIRSEQGEQIRAAFVPEEGWELITADYSQIELRLLAHFCGDEELRRAFAEDRDIHARVAAQVFGVEESLVTSHMRRMAKMINFGIIYGISAFGLAQRLEISKEEAAKFIDAYFARYPKVQSYQDGLLAECHEKKFVPTILGRKRRIEGVRKHSSYRNRNQPEREAINMQIQGSAADLIKVAMLNIHRRLVNEKRRTRLLLQIHDELVFEALPVERDDILHVVHQEMTGALRERVQVPLKVDMAVGPNWLDAQEVQA